MESKIRMAALAIAVAATTGCAGTVERTDQKALTYDWEAENRVAEVQFQDNHLGCTEASRTISMYEECMVSRGYSRWEP